MPDTLAHVSPLPAPYADRRRAERFLADQAASCHPTWNLDTTAVRVKDVSRQGVGLVTARRFEPGTVLVLELAETSPPLNVLTRVVRCVLRAEGTWLAGCIFLGEVSDDEFATFRTARGASSRRAAHRKSGDRPASCRLVGVGTIGKWIGVIRDVSDKGFALVLSIAVEPGTKLKIDIPAEGEEPARSELVSAVRREKLPDDRWLIGCEVVAPSPSRAAAAPVKARPAEKARRN